MRRLSKLPPKGHMQASSSRAYLPSLGIQDALCQPMQREVQCLDEQFTLLAAQSASVQERRRALREQQRIRLALSFLVIPPRRDHSEREEVDSHCPSSNSGEAPRSRFSHSSPPSPVVSCPQDISIKETDVDGTGDALAAPTNPTSYFIQTQVCVCKIEGHCILGYWCCRLTVISLVIQ